MADGSSQIRFRRSGEQPRVEIVPLIDVVFLILTFFIYAMVLMIPAKVLPAPLPEFSQGQQGEHLPAVTVELTSDGHIVVDREPVSIEDLLVHVTEAVEQQPGTVVYVTWVAAGDTDRLPIFGEVWQQLSSGGFDIRFVGRPKLTGDGSG